MIVLAHLSDVHLDGGERAHERAARVMAYINGLTGIDAVLVTGDIADHGEPAEYEEAAQVLTSPFLVITCPGNHDVPASYRKVLLRDAPINRRYDVAAVAVLVCNSAIPGRDEGRLDGDTLQWIADQLDDTPTLIAFHHPPVPMHQPYFDTMLLTNATDLAELLARHPQVVGILNGHAHSAAATSFAGVPVRVGPGVVSTLRLPWEGGDRIADLELPPAVAFHVIADDRTITTHYRVVP